MKLFSAASIHTLEAGDDILSNLRENLNDALEKLAFQPLSASGEYTSGWSAPGEGEGLALEAMGRALIQLKVEERKLRSSVVKAQVRKEIEELKARGEEVDRARRKQLVEKVKYDLLPKILPDESAVDAIIDFDRKWLIVNNTSAKKVDMIARLLESSVPGLRVEPFLPEVAVGPKLTEWVRDNNPPVSMEFGQKATLVNPDGKGKIKYSQEDIASDTQLASYLEEDYRVTELELDDAESNIAFVLNEGFVISGIRWRDVVLDEGDEEVSTMLLVSDGMRRLVDRLTNALHE